MSDYGLTGKRMKIFLVDIDDLDREHVLAGIVENVKVDVDTQTDNIYSEYSLVPVAQYQYNPEATLSARFVPGEDGKLLRIESFAPEEDEDEQV